MMSPLMSLLSLLVVVLVNATPLEIRTVYAPPITSPTADTVWTVGEVETVTWNATGIPAGVTGMIMLGYLTPGNEHLNQTLASGFNLTDEQVKVTVPAVVSRTNYIVVLFGDSGNTSPEFTIQGSSSSTTSNVEASTAAATETFSIATPTSSGSKTVTRSPPIATGSFSPPLSAATNPSSSSASPSSLTTSPSAAVSPSPSNNAGWSSNRLNACQVAMAPLALLLLL
ncbi:hypothetical protein B0H10DRAFT_2016042 [Mycena sp. CBHHK59/15]|nr:hypothetical protein B0H10DRAFT_2016042 [Mycena sp. CBHHK59/15]